MTIENDTPVKKTVCIGHGGLDKEGNSQCPDQCETFTFWARYGQYDHCACGASVNCHLDPNSDYVTRTNLKKRKT